MSRTTHELNKAKNRVYLAALALQANPESIEKRLALTDALDDLERDRNTVQGAILKSLLGQNPTVNLLAADDVGGVKKSADGGPSEQPLDGLDSFSITERIRKRREQDGMPGGVR